MKDPDFDSYFKREWAFFPEINDISKSSPSLLWETGKGVLRGKIISYQNININNPTEETQYKSGKYLANQLKRNKEKVIISDITNSAGKSTNSPDEINHIFRNFYNKLYSAEKDSFHFQNINSFLNSINLPQLNEHQKTALNHP